MSTEEWENQERFYRDKALDLCKGFGAAYNLAPVIDALKWADKSGFDIVKKASLHRAVAVTSPSGKTLVYST